MITEIQLVDQFSSVILWASNYPSIPTTLYLSRICKITDLSIPQPFNRFMISCVFIPQNAHQQASARFLNCVYSDQLVCLAHDESAESIFIIFFSNLPHINSFVLLKISPEELWSDSLGFSSQISLSLQDRIRDIKMKSSFSSMCENYIKCLNEWIAYSVSQYSTINDLSSELNMLKEKVIEPPKEEVVERKEVQHATECVLCKDQRRNVVFIPCGHVVVCSACVQSQMNIEINKDIKHKKGKDKCIICKKGVKEVREVFF